MAKVISIHEYDLKPGAVEADFERAILEAERRGLFALPGLVDHARGISNLLDDTVSRGPVPKYRSCLAQEPDPD